jgi:hypothetical protein
MNKSNLITVLKNYSQADIMRVIWGDIPKSEQNAKRQIICNRLKHNNFNQLELEKLETWLRQKQ